MTQSISEQCCSPTALIFRWGTEGHSAAIAGVFEVQAQAPAQRGSTEDLGSGQGWYIPQERTQWVLPQWEARKTQHRPMWLQDWLAQGGIVTMWA